MSNATFSRKPLVAAVLTTLAVFSAGAPWPSLSTRTSR